MRVVPAPDPSKVKVVVLPVIAVPLTLLATVRELAELFVQLWLEPRATPPVVLIVRPAAPLLRMIPFPAE